MKFASFFGYLAMVTVLLCGLGSAQTVTGLVTTSGTAVTWSANTSTTASAYFNPGALWVGKTITINSVTYTVASVASNTSLTLTGTAGTQASPVAYSIPVTDSLVVYETDNATQNNRPTGTGRVFADLEIQHCPKPIIGGVAPSAGDWQFNVKNRWPSGYVKFGFWAAKPSLTASGSKVITFSDVSVGSAAGGGACDDAGGLTWAQMKAFDCGGGASSCDAQMIGTPGAASASAAAVTVSSATLLAADDPTANTWGDGKNNVWLSGPVLTAVLLENHTSSFTYDFGWNWNHTNMASDGSHASYTGTSQYAQFHPLFMLYFYPSINAVLAEEILELPYYIPKGGSGSAQDQLADFTFKTKDNANTLQTRWSQTGARKFTMSGLDTFIGSTSGGGFGVGNYYTAHVAMSIATAGFTGSDVGNSIAFSLNGAGIWTYVQSVSSGTVAAGTTGQEGFNGTGLGTDGWDAFVNLKSVQARYRKVFWIGTSPGHVNFDHNFAYLKSTYALPNYDPNVTSVPDHGYYNTGSTKCCTGWAWQDWLHFDHGDIGGTNAWQSDYSQVVEGAPMQRNELTFLYNMGTCGTANSACHRALQQLTGNTAQGGDPASNAAIDTTFSGSSFSTGLVAGGGGDWWQMGQVPFHGRNPYTAPTGGNQTGTANCFYVSQLENKNATVATVKNASSQSDCLGGGDGNVTDPTGPNNATGRAISRHATSDKGDAGGGDLPAAITLGDGTLHWLDYTYLAYLLTADPYYLDEEYFSASFMTSAHNPVENGGAMTISAQPGSFLRGTANEWQSIARAAFIAPDGSADQAYYSTVINGSIGAQEGAQNISGTNLTPASRACSGSSCSYNLNAVNRWDWGRLYMAGCYTSGTCTTISGNALLWPANGQCLNGEVLNVDPVKSAVFGGAGFQFGEWMAATKVVRELGFPVASVHNQMLQSYLGRAGEDSGAGGAGTFNIFFLGQDYYPTKSIPGGGTSCTANNTDPFFTTWNDVLNATKNCTLDAGSGNYWPSINQNSFGASFTAGGHSCNSIDNSICLDHSATTTSRLALSSAAEYGTTLSDANCPGGQCSGTTVWHYAAGNSGASGGVFPFFGEALSGSSHDITCATYDTVYGSATDGQVKFAFFPRSGISIAACNSLSPSSATISILGTQDFTADCTYSDSSTGPCTPSLSSGTPSVATVAGVIATGVSGGSSTISATAGGFDCGNTSALTVTVAAAGGSVMTPGVKMLPGTILK